MTQVLQPGLSVGDSLSAHVAGIEQHLAGLDAAFVSGNSDRIDAQCQALQRSLADSLVAFRQAEHAGVTPLSGELLQRLKLAQARVQAQQAAVHRAHASIDRTLNVLLPRQEGDTYGAPALSPAAKALKAYR